MSTVYSDILKYTGNKSVFCSAVTAQLKLREEIVGPNMMARPKSGRSCTTLW